MKNYQNSFTDDELREMITGDNPQSNSWRELLAYREAQGKPSLSVQFKDGWPVPELVGLTIGAPLIPDGIHDFYAAPQLPAVPDGLIAAVNRLLDSDGSRGCFSAIRCYDAQQELEAMLPQHQSQAVVMAKSAAERKAAQRVRQ